MIDSRPAANRADFYLLADNRYRPAPAGDDGIYRSKVLEGFWLRIEWLWMPEPPAYEAFLEIMATNQA